jgi:hypothetical protein
MNTQFPQTLVEARRYFSDQQVAFDFMVMDAVLRMVDAF